MLKLLNVLLTVQAACSAPAAEPTFRWLEDTQGMADFLKQELAELNPAFSGDPASFAFDLGSPRRRVSCTTRDGEAVVTLANELETETLTLSDIRLPEQLALVRPYVSTYVAHVRQILPDTDALRRAVADALREVSRADTVEVESVEEAGPLLVVKLREGGDNSRVEVSVDNHAVHFHTHYFENTFQVSVPTAQFVAQQTRAHFTGLLAHYRRLKVFAGPNVDRSLHRLSCADFFAGRPGAVLRTQLGEIPEPVGGQVRIGDAGTLRCDETVGDEVSTLRVRFEFDRAELAPVSQTLLLESMYDTTPVLESFAEELSALIRHATRPQNPAEDVPDFAPVSSSGIL